MDVRHPGQRLQVFRILSQDLLQPADLLHPLLIETGLGLRRRILLPGSFVPAGRRNGSTETLCKAETDQHTDCETTDQAGDLFLFHFRLQKMNRILRLAEGSDTVKRLVYPGSLMPEKRPNLYGMERDELQAVLEPLNLPDFHAGQIFRWMYRRNVLDPERWTDLPKPIRLQLARSFRIDPGTVSGKVEADDGTIKYLIDLPGGGRVETVFMVWNGRITLCLSSQVGCALGCSFCLTAKMGLKRNLAAGEILGQVQQMRRVREIAEAPFNIVFMGMGEPLHNYREVTRAIRLLTGSEGGGISRKRITLSTAGLVPEILRLAREPVRPRL
jgi:hypothetical protein